MKNLRTFGFVRRYGSAALLSLLVFAGACTPVGEPTAPREREVAFTYHFTLQDIPTTAGKVMAWIPIPATNNRQTLGRSEVLSTNGRVEQVTEGEYGNRFYRFDFTEPARRNEKPTATVRFTVLRKTVRVLSSAPWGAEHKASNGAASLKRFLEPDRLIPIDGRIAEEARSVTTQNRSKPERARRLFDHIVDTVRYDKSGTGWGRGDAAYVCDLRAGNCTDFHSLFIGQARSLNIPARFIMGFPVPENKTEGTIAGYHCWAEFYLEDRGWVPLDASEAYKHPKRRNQLYGGLDADRIAFSIGRDIKLPGASGKPVNYVIYPYVEVDGNVHAAYTRRFTFRDVGPAFVR